MTAPPRQILLALLGGSAALVVVHALGRFAFTPLLPHFLADGLVDLQQGSQLATWNYVGYLLGALLALLLHAPPRLRLGLPLALLLNALITLAQCFASDYALLLVLRLANGISNGVVFVLAPALVLEWLASRQRAGLSGLVYLGFAAGLLLSNGLANWPADALSGAQRWLPMAALAVPLALLGAWLLARLQLPPRPASGTGKGTAPATALFDRASTPLFLAYAGAGLGYILPMTFLPTLAREQLPAGDPLLEGAWRWTALACLLSIPLWNHLGARLGDRRALLASYALQALGAAAPLLWPGATGVLLCALLVGGTFVGSVLLTQRLARSLQPHQGPRLSAALIALYGGAQLAGPWLAGLWIGQGGSLTQSFALGASALLWALAWTWLIPVHSLHKEIQQCPT
ncbi:YbfB/YjiJ family MFS transporter [Azotobacter chroococcum]|uniref:YbfB/YjiJ family MFS transporter n=1 Tax=Azotobacter chroococcum TaxID=353 RepID=A0AA43ZA35_9GAMM|nr:YbfB/YjiJ family MFS transporter [Azotobacter chroococcum]NHN78848.1 YbfB/YjiJ family MFS transporter [Azotobacter chroococcum]